MHMRALITFIGLLLVTMCGCMHTVIGGWSQESPDRHYELSVTSHGAAGKAYIDTSRKHVYLRISDLTGLTDSFHQEYQFVAADLEWRVEWRATNIVSVEFFDCGDKISAHDEGVLHMLSNHIATARFQCDPVTGKVSEIR